MNIKEIEQLRKENRSKIIHGKFVTATKNEENDTFFIKMSEIKSIQYISNYQIDKDEIDYCSFNTYKDHTYYTWLNAFDLVKEINNSSSFKEEQ